MYLDLAHTKLPVYSYVRQLVQECYKVTGLFPDHEKFGLTSQIRRAATSAFLNVSEGSSRRSSIERRRYYEIARGSIVEVDAALEIAYDLNYYSNENAPELQRAVLTSFKQLSLLIKSMHEE